MSIACGNCRFLLWMGVSHQSTSQLMSTRMLARTKKPLFYPASGVSYSQLHTDVSTSRAADTENCSEGGDSISPVHGTADNNSNVFYEAINAAADATSDPSDTFWTPHLAGQWTGNEGDYTHTPTGNTGSLLTLCAGRRKRRHCGWPKRFLELFNNSGSAPLIWS